MGKFDEIAMYFLICRDAYPDDFAMIQGLKGDSIYSQRDLDRACAEVAYIQDHDCLPAWATVVESFERVDDAYMFVYRGELA